ncbi:hypothetical protein [Flavobacterium terrisoli]|uniref:hypothetical protein n=1 Tax=Flavobacterium terrisoli TaxID=3242195 RepID=UPI002542EC04|nr:hypothetical protein [Flavobacterium buctense]
MEKKHNLSQNKPETKAQTQSAYDSHSEEKPQQKEVINTNSSPDRVSHNNTDDYLDKLPKQKEKTKETSDDNAEEEDEENDDKDEFEKNFLSLKLNSNPDSPYFS